MSTHRGILLVLLVTMTGALFAAQTPNTARGFSPGGTYHTLGIDTVNTFNGNLTLSIPIGQVYPIGGGLSYQLRLYANGNLWEAEDRVDLDPQTNGDCSPPPHSVQIDCIHAWPDRRANAGIGWTMSLGRLFPAGAPTNEQGWMYESPDGAEYVFSDQLWSPTADGNDSYTTDGSFLRMTVSGSERIVEFPNGEKHVFRPNDDPSTTADDGNVYLAPWHLDRITNRYSANVLQFTYDRMNTKIVMSDGYRTQTIHYGLYNFEYGTIAPINPSPSTPLVNQRMLVSSIDVAAFGEPVNGQPISGQYTFGYTQVSQSRPDWHTIPADYVPYAATVQQLTSLTLPDGTSYAFTYWNITDPASGYPETMKVPTGAKIRWMYEHKAFPIDDGDWLSRPYGVKTREIYDRTVTMPVATWNYGYTLTSGSLKVTVTDPVLTKTENFFDVSSGNMDHPDYGLPVTKQTPDATGTRWLSRRTYLPNQSTPSRSVYHRYFQALGSRELESTRVVHDDDGGVYLDTHYENYDGAGHFRIVRTSGTDLPEHVTTTQYNATSGTFPNFTIPAPGSPWILNTYTERTVSENGTVLRSQYCFDANGFLTRRRQLKNIVPAPGTSLPAESGQDTITVYLPDSRGNVAAEEYYGGDNQSLSTASLCGASLGSPVYRLDHTWSNGSLSTSQYAGATSFYVANSTIDANTGLASNSVDTTGEVSAAFTYDKMARPLTVQPEGRAWTAYSYPDFSSTFEITQKQVPNGQPLATPLLSSKYVIDAFGRIGEEKVSMPGTSTESRRKMVYNALGWQMSVSELGNAATLPVTGFTYDGYGRVKSITAPDTSVTNFNYTGIRQKTRTTKVSMSPTAADTLTSVVEKYDLHGRLVSVTESSGPTSAMAPVGGSVSTHYTYDPVDRMISVRMVAADGTTQFRRFDHDGRGFLRWESHPESGMTTYTYDPRGHVLTRHQSAAGSLFDLEYTYDAAERPLTIKGRNPHYSASDPDQPEFRIMKSFSYATANNLSLTPPDYAKGKLASAARYNYDPANSNGFRYKVTDQYSYRDGAGRKTNRRTIITRGTGIDETWWWPSPYKTIDTAVTYDDLDQTTLIDYPKCVGCAVPAHQTQTFTYDKGRLASANGFVTGMTYHPNGMWSAINRSNGMSDTQTLDSSGMARPASISAGLWDSCTPVTIGDQPVGGSITSSTPSVTMDVGVGGTAPLSYQWSADGSDIPGATSSSYSATPSVTTRYQVRIWNGCSSTLSEVALVSVNECEPPYEGASNKRNPNGTYTLSASDTGTQPLSYEWRRQGNQTIIGQASTLTIAAPSVDTTYTVTISNDCSGSPVTASTTIVLPLTMGTIQAVWNGTSTVNVSWPASSGAAEYSIERRSGGTWGVIGTTAFLSFPDTVTTGKTYAYRVRAVDSTGTTFSPYSNSDVATTIAFPQVTAGSAVTAASVEPMLTAVNAVRTALGWPSVTWANILSSSDRSPTPAVAVRASHVLTCRARMNEALQALGVPVSVYTNPDLVGGAIKADHINELTARTQ